MLIVVVQMPELSDSETVEAQFNRLMYEVIGGHTRRNTFRPWEIEILLDIESCNLSESYQSKIVLRQYQKAVQRRIEKGARLPLKLSEYIESLKANRTQRKGPPGNEPPVPQQEDNRARR